MTKYKSWQQKPRPRNSEVRLDETARGFMHTDTEFATSSSQAPSALGWVGCVVIPPGMRERRRVGRPDRHGAADSPRLAWDRGESAMTGPSGFRTHRRSRIPGEMPIQPTHPSAEGAFEELVANLVSVCIRPRAVSSKCTSELLRD